MISGALSGLLWALETVILGIALAMSPFASTEEAIFLAPFVSTAFHDTFSAIYMWIYNACRGKFMNFFKAFKKGAGGRWIFLGAIVGGPIGMTGYILSVNYMGSSIGAVSSAIYPAIGAILSRIFLKEKMKWYQYVSLLICLVGVYLLSYSPDIDIKNFWLGLLGAGMCAIGWGVEAVIVAYGLRNSSLTDEVALQIRQSTSSVVYLAIILPALQGWPFAVSLFNFSVTEWLIPCIALAAIFATASYLFYYKAIAKIGASKAMALNITYVAWSIVLSIIILKDTSVLNPLTIISAIVVLLFGLFAAIDVKTLFVKERKTQEESAAESEDGGETK